MTCGNRFGEKLSPVLLGSGKRLCKKCGAVFREGCKEWTQRNGSEKNQHFFSTMVLGFSGAASVLPVVATRYVRDPLEVALPMAVIIFLIFTLPWIPPFLLEWLHIPRSRVRCERHRIFGDTDGFIL
jgi:hypothetical protein